MTVESRSMAQLRTHQYNGVDQSMVLLTAGHELRLIHMATENISVAKLLTMVHHYYLNIFTQKIHLVYGCHPSTTLSWLADYTWRRWTPQVIQKLVISKTLLLYMVWTNSSNLMFCYICQGGYVYTGCLLHCVCVSVCLLAMSHENYWLDLHEKFYHRRVSGRGRLH